MKFSDANMSSVSGCFLYPLRGGVNDTLSVSESRNAVALFMPQ